MKIDAIMSCWEKSRAAIESDCGKVYLVNMGRMNHGKSSLFNAILDRETFKTGDLRVTRKNSLAKLQDNVFLVDTPGLDADDADDEEAYSAYQKASCLFYVHNVKVGELHKSEIKHLKHVAERMPSPAYLNSHFCMVLTGKDEYDEDSLARIEQKILQDMEQHCGLKGFCVFAVSNSTYFDGKAESGEDAELMLAYSGIQPLRDYMNRHLAEWQQDAACQIRARLETVSKAYCQELSALKEAYAKHLAEMKHNKNHAHRLIAQIDVLVEEGEELKSELDMKKARLANLKQKLKRLKEQHKQELECYREEVKSELDMMKILLKEQDK